MREREKDFILKNEIAFIFILMHRHFARIDVTLLLHILLVCVTHPFCDKIHAIIV